jgi:hypothetical protein
MRILIAESEPPAARKKRRDSVGRSSRETFIKRLRQLVPDATCHRVKPADHGGETPHGFDSQCICGSNHISSDPRCFSAALYSGQFVVRFRCGRFGHHAHLSRAIPSGNPKR